MASTAGRAVAASLALIPATATVATTAQADAPTGLVEGALPAIPDLESLQGCTAYFGLTKDNSVPMVIEETVEGPLTPAPTIGDGITPVATITLDDDSVVTCILEKAWTDEASFRTFHAPTSAIPIDFTAYPGSNVYLVPGYGVGQASVWSRWFVAFPNKADNVAIEFVVDEQYLPDFTVTNSASFVPWAGLDGFSTTQWTGTDEFLTYLRGLIRPLLSPAAQTELDALSADVVFSCSDPEAPTLEAELLALIPVSADLLSASNACNLAAAAQVAQVLPMQIENNTVDVLVQSQAPTTTATPTTVDDGILSPTIPSTGADESARHTAVGAGLMAALGAALVLITRRRRPA